MDHLTIKPFKFANSPSGSQSHFSEFFINDTPLSQLLSTFFYNNERDLLDHWIGLLGAFNNPKCDALKIKQLLRKKITGDEIRGLFPSSLSAEEMEDNISRAGAEFEDPEVLLYGCKECGEYECGGVGVAISKMGNLITWSFNWEEKTITFEFDEFAYFGELNKHLKMLKE